MTSYISTQSLSSLLRQSTLRMQSELASGETELATGNYADIGLELGGRTGETVSLQAEASLLQTITSTNQTAALRLDTTESVLSNVQSAAQDLLDSLIHDDGSGANASTIQASGKTNFEGLISALNSSLNGDYIFAGTNTSNQPITDYYAAAAPNKAAVDSAFAAAFGMPQSNPGVSAISGASMQSFLDTQFAPLFQGTSWTANWSSASSQPLTNRISESQTANTSVSANNTAFQQLAQAYAMIADLGTQTLNSSAYQAVTSTARSLLTSAISKLIDLQASAGLVQSDVSTASSQISVQMNILSTQIGKLESVDPYEITTRVTDLKTQIETSYSLTSQLQQLSLVKYL
jgi:flagellar hook-associated protein 3 FlgL